MFAAKHPIYASDTVVELRHEYISHGICNEAVTWLQAALVIQKCYHGYCQRLELNHSCTCGQVGTPLDRASAQRLKRYHSAGEVRIKPTERVDVRDSFADHGQHTSCQDLESV